MKLNIGGCDTPRQSIVRVQFSTRGSELSYYNDLFDLHVGDFVYVEGHMEGQRGRVVEVEYNFKIKRSDYKRVIARVDTGVRGEFFFAGSHFVTFDRNAIPAEKVVHWFKAPTEGEDDVISGNDDTSFKLDDLHTMKITPAIAERGRDYYLDNKVVYISVDGDRGYAIVEGSEPYEVEFTYREGEISHLTCTCFCSGNCKHIFAAMLQLRDVLKTMEKHYADEYARTGYFAAMFKGALYFFAIDGNEVGCLTLNG